MQFFHNVFMMRLKTLYCTENCKCALSETQDEYSPSTKLGNLEKRTGQLQQEDSPKHNLGDKTFYL